MLHRLVLALTLSLTAACETGEAPEVAEPANDEPDNQVGETEPNPDTVTDSAGFQVLLTGAPGDFDEVWVDIVTVEIRSDDQRWVTLSDTRQSFDLLTLQNDVTAALGEADLEPGHYDQLRLVVDNAFVVASGVSEDLAITSGAHTGIEITLDADVEDGMAYTLVIDFDAEKSVKQTGQYWLMTPSIAVKDLTAIPANDPGGEPSISRNPN